MTNLADTCKVIAAAARETKTKPSRKRARLPCRRLR